MRQFPNVLLLAAALLSTACSSESTIEEEQVVDDGRPMVFGTSFSTVETTEITRAATPLEADFRVGAWKAFGQAGQQTVMDGYRVAYDAAATPYKWNYVGVNSQIQRYWDLAAYPYEFRAVSPYYADGVSITPTGITVNKPFIAQTLIEDAYKDGDGTPITGTGSEPCVVSHVSRKKVTAEGGSPLYEDADHIKGEEINDASKANPTREVHLPFHHLISKVGFRIYIDNPQPLWSDYTVSLQSIEITVKRADGFVYRSNTYTATGNLGKGVFSDNTTTTTDAYATEELTLLKHTTPYKEVSNGVEKNLDFHNHLNREHAFDLSPNYLQQIPQKDIKVHVKLTMHTHHVEGDDVEFSYDSWLSLDKTKTTEAECDLFTWEPEKRYIYYLHIPNLHGHDIMLDTCEILPWEEVKSTDIKIEM